jgi:hypothetical protein
MPAGSDTEADLRAVGVQRAARALGNARKARALPMNDEVHMQSAAAGRGHGSLNRIVQ